MAEPLFCTKIASRLTRTYTDRHGLKDLVKDLLDIDLSKQQQSSDWAAETLCEAQLAYAASDVLHLHALKAKLERAAAREGRRELADSLLRLPADPGPPRPRRLGRRGHLRPLASPGPAAGFAGSPGLVFTIADKDLRSKSRRMTDSATTPCTTTSRGAPAPRRADSLQPDAARGGEAFDAAQRHSRARPAAEVHPAGARGRARRRLLGDGALHSRRPCRARRRRRHRRRVEQRRHGEAAHLRLRGHPARLRGEGGERRAEPRRPEGRDLQGRSTATSASTRPASPPSTPRPAFTTATRTRLLLKDGITVTTTNGYAATLQGSRDRPRPGQLASIEPIDIETAKGIDPRQRRQRHRARQARRLHRGVSVTYLPPDELVTATGRPASRDRMIRRRRFVGLRRCFSRSLALCLAGARRSRPPILRRLPGASRRIRSRSMRRRSKSTRRASSASRCSAAASPSSAATR